MFRSALYWLFPSLCVGCQRVLPLFQRVCCSCLSLVTRVTRPLCVKCGKPILGLPLEPTFEGICPDCLEAPRGYDAARSPALYVEPLKEWIALMKYRHDPYIAVALGTWAAHQMEDWLRTLGHLTGVTCVPLHPRRKRTREYNQAEWIARAIAKELDRPWMTTLERVHFEGSQVGRTRPERWAHVLHAFRVPDRRQVRGGIWLLVDDVHTTGATLHACSVALKRAGARHVYALTVATTPAIMQG